MNLTLITWRWAKRVFFVVVLFALTAIGGAKTASAHAFLQTSDPAANAVIPSGPERVSMRFTEPIEHTYTRADLYDQTGKLVAGTAFQFDDRDNSALTLSLPPNLANGTYTVTYRTLSAADGHQAQGYFAFTIGTQSDVVTVIPPATTGPSGPPQWLRGVSRWIPLLGLCVCVAVWPIWLLVIRPGISPAWQTGPLLTRRVQKLAAAGIVVALLGSLFALIVQADGARDGNSLLDATRTVLTDTRYGQMWIYRVLAIALFAICLAFCAWWWPKRRTALTIVTVIAAAALPLPFSLISHASAQTEGRNSAIAFDTVHLIGASIWIGGLFVLVFGLLPTLRDLTPAGRRVVLARTLPRFSAVAVTAWAVLGVTGLYSAWLQVGNLKGLTDTAYGHSLIAKLLLLIPLLLLGAFNLLVVSPRFRRQSADGVSSHWVRNFAFAVGLELILVIAVLFVVGRLTSEAPGRETLAMSIGQVTLKLDAQGRSGTLSIAPAVTGPNHYRLDLSGDTLPDKTEAVLRLTVPNVSTGQKEIQMVRIGGNSFEAHGSELSIAGNWQVQAIVRKIGEFQWQATSNVDVKTTATAPSLPRQPWRFNTAAGIAGLILLLVGFAGFSLAWFAGKSPLRREGAGLGAVALVLGAVLLLQGRTSGSGLAVALTAKSPVVADDSSITKGQSIFAANCAVCHGTMGRGDGPAANTVDPPYPKPADFATAHARAHYDGEFFNWIKSGKLNTAMPAFGKTLNDRDIWNVINFIRWMQQHPDQQYAPGSTTPMKMEMGTPVASPAASPAATTPVR